MRVMCEDLRQRDEKKRLINLLENQAGGEDDPLVSSSSGFEKRTRSEDCWILTWELIYFVLYLRCPLSWSNILYSRSHCIVVLTTMYTALSSCHGIMITQK